MGNSSAIILYDKNKKILLQHRSDDAPTEAGKWGFFGGRIEEKETPLECVKRECEEELGYKLKNPKLVHEKVIGNSEKHIFIEEYDPSKNLNLKEGKDMRWFSFEDVKNLDIVPFAGEIIEKIKETINSQT